ncbi:MAG TPA: nuclease-related domain-containing protein [Solirubrobacteraceae bacterium]|jgi:hypothetical protein|nr:nuclease-related domain-containing protein [Solirubrobacteraceae bacterium]
MRTAAADPTRRTAGQYARATVHRLRLRTLVALGVLGIATAALGRTFGLHDPLFLCSELALLATIFVVMRYVLPLVERRDRGATGEEHVGALLAPLTEHGWEVIHDASFGHGNVDHILLGPPGIFTIETKSHPGPIRVGRVHGATLSQARSQSDALERATGLSAEPLIVYSRAWVDRPGARRRGVRVLPARMLVGHLEKRPAQLSLDEVRHAHGLIGEALLERAARGRAMYERWQLIR